LNARGINAVRLLLYFIRALFLRCPSCGHTTIVRRPLAIHAQCRDCGLYFNHDDGFWLGAWHFNYMAAAVLAIVPAMVGVATGAWDVLTATLFGVVVSILFPILFYWHSYSFWIATFYYFVPDDLRMGHEPARTPGLPGSDALLTDSEREQSRLEEAILELEGDKPSRWALAEYQIMPRK
jgi:uncharacterized protein (DUF983 family)